MFFKNGVPVTEAKVGDTITYDVAGHSPGQIWLYQTKDGGATQWNGPFNIPMVGYTFTDADIGHYMTYAYELVGGTYGNLIEATQLDVTSVGGGINLTSSNVLLYGGIALAAFFLLRR